MTKTLVDIVEGWKSDAAQRERQSKEGSSVSSIAEDIREGAIAQRMQEMIAEVQHLLPSAQKVVPLANVAREKRLDAQRIYQQLVATGMCDNLHLFHIENWLEGKTRPSPCYRGELAEVLQITRPDLDLLLDG